MSSKFKDLLFNYVYPEVKVAVGFGLIIPVKEKLNLGSGNNVDQGPYGRYNCSNENYGQDIIQF